jgi:hypothetical protein
MERPTDRTHILIVVFSVIILYSHQYFLKELAASIFHLEDRISRLLPPNHFYPLSRQHGVTSQKPTNYIFTTMTSSNLT